MSEATNQGTPGEGDRFAILTFRHLDGVLSADEALEFNALLRASPRMRGHFIELVQREILLADMAPGSFKRTAWMRGMSLWRWILACVVAVLLVVAGFIAWVSLHSLPPSVIRLASIDGVVRIWRHGATVPAVAGFNLYAGDRIEVVSGSCQVGFADADTRLELADEASLLIGQVHGRMSLRLDQGRLTGEVDDQTSGSGLVIESPHARVRAVGAKFTCTIARGATSLAVRRGVVTFAAHKQVDAMLVTAGRVLTTDGNYLPRDATPPDVASPVPKEIPRRWQIDAAAAVAIRGRGWQGKPMGDRVLSVVDDQTGYQLVSPPASESGLVAAGPGLLAHVHLHVAKPCNVGVLLMVHDASGAWLGNIQAERLIHADQPQELVLSWEDFRMVDGVAKERLAQGVVGQMMIMCWEKDARLEFFMVSLEK